MESLLLLLRLALLLLKLRLRLELGRLMRLAKLRAQRVQDRRPARLLKMRRHVRLNLLQRGLSVVLGMGCEKRMRVAHALLLLLCLCLGLSLSMCLRRGLDLGLQLRLCLEVL